MADRDLVRAALIDAIDWQQSLGDAYRSDAPERRIAREQEAAYRKLLKRRYGTDRTPMETAMDGAPSVTIQELIKRLTTP
jgi:hypothetical protein